MICINRYWLDAAKDNAAERKLFASMVSPICVCSEKTQGDTCRVTMIAVEIDSIDECKHIAEKIRPFTKQSEPPRPVVRDGKGRASDNDDKA